MRHLALATILVACFSASAFANGASNNCNGRDNCSTNSTVNKGGTGVGIGIGKGGSAKSKASASVDSKIKNNVSSTNVGVNVSKNKNSANNEGVEQNVEVQGDNYETAEIPVASAAPTFLTSSNDTCMGSSGLGAQGMNFGVSLGTTWTDGNCIMLKNARELRNQGHEKAAKARLCMDEDNALAFELAGEPCPQALPTARTARASVAEYNRHAIASAQVASARTDYVPTIDLAPVAADVVNTDAE